MRRLGAVLLFVLVATLVALALVRGWGMVAPDRGRFVVEIQPGESVDYGLGPEVERVRLVSGVVLGDGILDDARLAQTYAIDLEWIAPGGEVRRAERIWERTRLSRWPGAGNNARRPAGVLDDGRLVTDPRTTELPGNPILPGGGVLRVTVPDGVPSRVLRVFGARPPTEASSDSVKAEEIRRASRRVGYPDIDHLEPAERATLLDQTWRSLPFASSADEGRLRRLRRSETGLLPHEESVIGSVLSPGQAIAITVVGPATLRVEGGTDLDEVALEAIGDLPADARSPRLTWRAAAPTPLLGGSRAMQVELLDPIVTSLIIRNPTNDTLSPLLVSLLEPSRDRLHGWTPASRPEELLGTTPAEWVFVGPERVEVPGARIGRDLPEPVDIAVPLGSPVIRVDVRPELDGPFDATPRRVKVAEVAFDGTVLREGGYEVSAWPAPFERRAEDGGWVGDPVTIELEPRPGVDRLRVSSDDALRVMAFVDGPPRGRDAYQLTHGDDVQVRYARDPERRWWRRWPDNTDDLIEAQQLASVLANVRLEQRAVRRGEGARHYAALRPIDGLSASGRTWLVPGAGAFDLAWCRFEAGAVPTKLQWDAPARRLRHGELRGVLHTPSVAAIGQRYRVEIDGRIWQQGQITQRIERLASIQEPRHHSARLVAPPGTRLWLRVRSDDETQPCYRGVRAWPLGPGDQARFALEETWEGRLLVVSGLASGPVRIEVAIEGLGEPFPGSQQDQAFVQEITLQPGEDLGQRLTDPDVRLPALQSETLRIGAEVPALMLRVRHLEGPRLWLRALAEVDDLAPPSAPSSARVRGGR